MDTVNSITTIAGAKSIKKLSEEEVEALWKQYFKDNSNKDIKDKLIVQYLNLTKYIVGRLRVTLPPTISTEDITGYGIEGLIHAIEKYSADKGTKFETYALMRIRGAIIDKIRSQDWIPRTTRKRFKDIQKVISDIQQQTGKQPTIKEIAEKMDLSPEKVQNAINDMQNSSFVSIHDKKGDSSDDGGVEIIDTIQDTNAKNPMQQLEEKDVKRDLSMALAKLPERERMILALYYHENMTLKEIGEAVKISESRVCQLHSQAIMKLRNLLSSNNVRLRKSII
ncbi:MAG: FliA/WhiG family RNA polymerase sigma factor [Candidatus Gastranaerophilales bacterium]|nr:FliA/WhiG family RNA polymerase sigma factor [Candidatus Gastranaerophilales bacterium]